MLFVSSTGRKNGVLGRERSVPYPFDGRTFLPGPRPECNETCRKNGVSKAAPVLRECGRSVVKRKEKNAIFLATA